MTRFIVLFFAILLAGCATAHKEPELTDFSREGKIILNKDGSLPGSELILTEKDKPQINKLTEEDLTSQSPVHRETATAEESVNEQTKEIKNLQSDMAEVREGLEAAARTILRHDDLLEKHEQRLNEIQVKISSNISTKPQGMLLGRFDKYSNSINSEIEDSIGIIVAGINKGIYKISEDVLANSDPVGNSEKNNKLSEQRAIAIAKRFVARFGKDKPVPWAPEKKWGEYFKPQGKGETPFLIKNGEDITHVYRAGKIILTKPQ